MLAVSPDRGNAAFRSRYCSGWPCADPHYDEEQFVADLEALGARLPRRGVLIPADDDFGVAVSRHKTRLEESFIVPVLPWERMQALADKELQTRLAWQAGVETPITAFIHGPDDLAVAADTVPFPAVLKSAVPMALIRHMGLKVVVIQDRERLEESFERLKPCGPLLLQEIIPGGDEQLYFAGGYHDERSRCVALFTGRKLRQHPRGFGVARLCETLPGTEMADLTRRCWPRPATRGSPTSSSSAIRATGVSSSWRSTRARRS